MTQKANLTYNIRHYDPGRHAVPKLVASDNEDVHNLVIISQNGLSTAVDIICLPTPNVYIAEKKYQTVLCFLEPGCSLKEGLSKCKKYIYEIIKATFDPGDWVDGGW